MRVACATVWLWCAAALVALAAGCSTTEQAEDNIDRGETPAFVVIAKKYNQRVAGLDRVWARSTVRFQGVDDKGREIDEQGEGHLQVIQPRKLYMTVGKVGDVGYQLGSNDLRYWWIDVREQFALVGKHETATGSRLEKAGLPVPPLDVLAVLGITELRQEGPTPPKVSWTRDGKALVVITSRAEGTREMKMDPVRYEPFEIVLKNKSGETTVTAELTEYAPVDTQDSIGGADSAARMATRIHLTAPKQATEITLWLHEAQNRGISIKERSFEFDSRVREYRVQRVKDLDEVRAGNAN